MDNEIARPSARLLLLASILSGAAAPATATTIIFGAGSCGGPASCSHLSPISQTFGDTADVDISYRSALGPGNTATLATHPLLFSDGGISGSDGAFVQFDSGSPSQVAEIRFDLIDGGQITLNSASFGSHTGSHGLLTWRVYTGTWAFLGSGGVGLTPAGLLPVTMGFTSTNGLILQFGGASVGGGIQNIDYSFSLGGPGGGGGAGAIPEPASWALLIAGFGLTGAARRQRRLAGI